jgi:hypothetical protein
MGCAVPRGVVLYFARLTCVGVLFRVHGLRAAVVQSVGPAIARLLLEGWGTHCRGPGGWASWWAEACACKPLKSPPLLRYAAGKVDNETPDWQYLLALRALALDAGIVPATFTKTGTEQERTSGGCGMFVCVKRPFTYVSTLESKQRGDTPCLRFVI